MNIWHAIKDEFIQKNNLHRHRASVDAMIIQETYIKTRTLAFTPTAVFSAS
jgi:hypothetical protein